MSQYMVLKGMHQLKFKKELKTFPSRINGSQQKSLHAGVEWKGSHWTIRKRNTREHIKRKPQNMAWKYFKVKTSKLYFDNLSIRVSQTYQCKLRQFTHLKIICTFSRNKVIRFKSNNYLGGIFNKTIIPLALVAYEMIIANAALRSSLAIHHLISNTCLWNNNC